MAMASSSRSLLCPHIVFISQSITRPLSGRRHKTHIAMSSNKVGDAELASDLASQVAKINTETVQIEEAMRKSRELLFSELCQYLALREDQVRTDWEKMEEDQKWVLVKGFVSVWSAHFHPLSEASVKEMVEAYLLQRTTQSQSTHSSSLFPPSLKKLLGF